MNTHLTRRGRRVLLAGWCLLVAVTFLLLSGLTLLSRP